MQQAKTTYRNETDSGIEIRKSFAVERDRIKVWKEEDDGTEITYIEVPVSSPSEDRDGDEFSDDGLESQKRQFQSGTVGMWLDHGLSPETMFPDYRVLEQIGGWKDAEIRDGELFAKAALRPSSDDAAELETMLDEGVAPVGFSVGFIVEKSEEKDESENGLIFHEVDLLECSAVGIPSNPDAMVSDSAMATAKAVADSGSFGGEPETLARAITREMRSLPYVNDTTEMNLKDLKQEGLEEVADAISEYLDADETSSDDVVPELVDWVSEEIGDDTASLVSEAAQAALESTDSDSIDDLTVSDLNGFVEETLESDDDGDGSDSGGDDDDDDDGDTDSADPGQLRSQIRDALSEVLLDALTDEEELRSLISEEVRDALADEEFSVEVTEDFKETLVDELRSELFKDSGDGRSKPAPAGTISVFEEEDEETESGASGNDGGSENASKPSPSIEP